MTEQTVTRQHLAGLELARKELSELNVAAKAAADYCLGPLIAQASAAPEQEPILVQAVAVTRNDDDHGLRLDWVLEGGISELEFAGTVLFAMPEANDLCDEDGSAYLYRHADPAEVERLRKDLLVAQSDIRVEQEVSSRLRQHKNDYMDAAEGTQRALKQEISTLSQLLHLARGAIGENKWTMLTKDIDTALSAQPADGVNSDE